MSVLLLTMGPQLGITADLPAVAVGGAGVIRFRAIGASGPVKWTLVDSTLPAEWDSALNPDGNAVTLTTSDAETAGTFSVTVRAVDNARIPVVRSFDVRVMALPLTITGAFPEWKFGVPATGTLTISGGVPPYSGLAITSGALPDGVSLSIVGNQIVASGAPTVAGPWSATIQVQDSSGAPAHISVSGDVTTLTYATWDAANKSPLALLTNGSLRLTSSTSYDYANTRTTVAVTRKTYLSFGIPAWGSGGGGTIGIGVCDDTATVGNTSWGAGLAGSGAAWGPSSVVLLNGVNTGVSSVIGAAAEMAIDPATRKVWIRNSGGSYLGGGDPETGSSPTFVVPGSGDIYVCASVYVYGGILDLRSAPGDITGTAPSGYTVGLY